MRRYPLEPLAELREQKCGEAVSALAEALRTREAAALALRAARARRDAQARAASVAREAELEALGQGALRAGDLARVDAWGVRVAAEREALTAGVSRAESTDESARRGAEEAQASVASRQAEARVVAEHRARWDADHRRALEARDEEASAEAWRPRR